MRKLLVIAISLIGLTVAGLAAVVPALAGDGSLSPELQEVRAAVARYHSFEQAERDADRPSLFGRAFEGPMPGHDPVMPVRYDMHVWVAEENPSGVLALFSPALSC